MPWSVSAFSLSQAPPARGGSVSGQVELTNSQDSAARKHNYSGVVLWLQPADRDAGVPMVPRHVEMKQQNKHFTPHVVAIQVGGTVDFPNLDPVYHNAFSKFSGVQFDIGLYPPGTSRTVPFRGASMGQNRPRGLTARQASRRAPIRCASSKGQRPGARRGWPRCSAAPSQAEIAAWMPPLLGHAGG